MTRRGAFDEGWYLMSIEELSRFLDAYRADDPSLVPDSVIPLERTDALAFRDAGNLPDDRGRSLRLVLRVEHGDDLRRLGEKRLEHEPDAHRAPSWRIEGSKPVNIVPLRPAGVRPTSAAEDWWDEPAMAALEEQWAATGAIDGVTIPGEYRGFLYKTIAGLKESGIEVTVSTLADSIERWLLPDEARRIRRALEEANG